ncbi:VCBS repeat-containing protein [uncultured Mucilaginibacter sp.]|uniref:FG-GAP repeat domain-containing protein n=1 Tax=uncultured Mucilaginibacter sp. TaxID=797541 RepID=UPI002629031C|nr:VCBS repeat-containing protein [uncultured Mucilaginibacter sp.]
MRNLKSNKVFFCSVLMLFIGLTCFYSCRQKPLSPQERLANDIADGGILAKKYCSNCHQFPEPALMNKAIWETGILPAMALKLGLEQYMGQTYAVSKSAISTSDWQKIVTYYKSQAPTKLTFPKPVAQIFNDWAGFSLKQPKNSDVKKVSLTTLVSFNPNDQKIYSADAYNNLYRWNENLKPELVAQLPAPATNVLYDKTNEGKNQAIITSIGTLPPRDVLNGQVLQLNLDQQKTAAKPVVFADSLPRPVQTIAADFNKDGLMDYAVCGFGHDQGGLYWLKQLPGKHFKTLPIRLIPGSTQMATGDFNNDGWPDLICLFAQADEGIWLFLNDRKGGFTAKNVLHFPPIYGSSSFQLVDFNHDGKPDILYTAGDNSDYSTVLKPYHGVYIFLNTGNFNFKKQFFYHIDGCTKAVAADFKHNGKLDIAVISFFADFKNDPTEGFEYLEQTQPLQFVPHKVPVEHYGRWLTMDVSDYNHDGFPDVVLGNFSMGGQLINQKNFKPNWDMHEPLVVLENMGSKKSK